MVTELTFRDKRKLTHFLKNRRYYHGRKYLGTSLILICLIFTMLGIGYAYTEQINGLDDNLIYDNNEEKQNYQQESPNEPFVITFDTLPFFLSQQKIFSTIPPQGKITLLLGDIEYSITAESIIQTKNEQTDLTIILPATYLHQLGKDACKALQTAHKNNDLTFKSDYSMLQLGWKYKTMMSEKNCLNI